MKTAESKTQAAQPKTSTSFFGKERGQSFFQPVRHAQPFFSKGSTHSGVVQTKLNIGQPGDHYEREADHMADKVVQRLSTPSALQAKPLGTVTPIRKKPIFESEAESPEQIQKCAACEQEEKQVQKKPDGSGQQSASPQIESSLNASKGSGSPLPDQTRGQMESSFGADFSKVRIHDNSSAVQMNKNLNAQAFTHGSDIYFGKGKYDTNSKGGQHLLAHELTHVVQQSQDKSQPNIGRKPVSIQRSLSTLCNAPSSWGMDPALYIPIGLLAHLIGSGDYLMKTGGTRGVDVYLDTFELIPIDPSYGGFIASHNPGLSSWKVFFLSYTPVKRPDFMIHRPGLTEFDELKPDSIPGVVEGMAKIYEIAGYMKALKLPYKFGTAYIPTPMIPLFSFTFMGTPVNVSMKFTRKRSGLIVYEICIETDWAKVALAALLIAIAILLALLIKRLPIPAPVPNPTLIPVVGSAGGDPGNQAGGNSPGGGQEGGGNGSAVAEAGGNSSGGAQPGGQDSNGISDFKPSPQVSQIG
jgi:Domain of unknown function (DUF4157)